jgi:hypothetical protein
MHTHIRGANKIPLEAYCGLEYPLLPMRFFLNIKWVAIVVCATVGAMVFYSMNVMWPNLVTILYTTNLQEAGWLSVRKMLKSPEY